jgi:hypothetical protein
MPWLLNLKDTDNPGQNHLRHSIKHSIVVFLYQFDRNNVLIFPPPSLAANDETCVLMISETKENF